MTCEVSKRFEITAGCRSRWWPTVTFEHVQVQRSKMPQSRCTRLESCSILNMGFSFWFYVVCARFLAFHKNVTTKTTESCRRGRKKKSKIPNTCLDISACLLIILTCGIWKNFPWNVITEQKRHGLIIYCKHWKYADVRHS